MRERKQGTLHQPQRRGHPRPDGAFAEYLSLPADNLHAVPETMDDETAVFAEPVAAACRIFEQMTVDPQARVAIVGDGRMGLLVAQVSDRRA